MKNILFMTINQVKPHYIEIHKKFLNYIQLFANHPDYSATLIFPHKGLYNFYKRNNLLLPNVTYILLFDYIKIQKSAKQYIYDLTNLYQYFPLPTYHAFVYFSMPFTSQASIYQYNKLENPFYISTTFSSFSSHIYDVAIPLLLQKKYNFPIYQLINDFNETISPSKIPNNFHTLSYYPTSDNMPSSYIFDYDTKLLNQPKTLTFSFAFSIIIKERTYLSDYIHNNLNQTFDIIKYEFNKYNPERNNPINQTDYYSILSRTKFTLIAPSTYPKRFSYLRFIEALQRKCIPILLEDSNYQDLKDFIDSDLFQIYQKYNLFLTYQDNINNKLSELNYDNIWNEIQNSDYFKKLIDTETKQMEILKLFC